MKRRNFHFGAAARHDAACDRCALRAAAFTRRELQ
jgi:hypothetical protein